MKTKLILSNFYSADDLKHGIEVLQRCHVPILEVYVSKTVTGLEKKLQIRALRQRHAAARFGFSGGIATSTLICYFMEQGWPSTSPKLAHTFIISFIAMVSTVIFVAYLLPFHTPKIINLQQPDERFLIIVDKKSISHHKEVRHLFESAEAVEMSPLIKNIVTI